jgi:hypothetical protein
MYFVHSVNAKKFCLLVFLGETDMEKAIPYSVGSGIGHHAGSKVRGETGRHNTVNSVY